MVICETVNSCNLDCIICAYSLQQRPRTLMPMDLFEKVLDDYSAMGGGAISLTPTVGDVLLDRRLAKRMDAIRRHPEIRAVSFTTNAVLASLGTEMNSRLLSPGYAASTFPCTA